MPITGINWDLYKNAMVVHVFPGTPTPTPSPDLRVKHLRFHLPTTERLGTRTSDRVDHDFPFAKTYLDDPAHAGDTTLTFTIADASVAPGTSTRSFAARGITLNGATGQVTVTTLPALFPRNFHLEVQAVSGGKTFKELIRVEVHRSITRIWLTPSTLKVRARRGEALPATTLSRFSVRAEFDDGVVGDITEFVAINWAPARNVTSEGRLIVAAGDAGGAPITITASLPGFPSVAAATANLQVLEPWGPSTPIEAKLVPGGGWANPFAIEAVPNVLFLPDGFPAGWETDFHDYVNALVQFLKTDAVCKPYDLLANSINFWAAFIPSDQAGVTWGSEVCNLFGGADVSTVPRLQRPQDHTFPEWGLVHLMYEVGLPIPSDAMSNTARTTAAILGDWDTLYGTGYRAHLPTDAAALELRVQDWRSLASRTLLDDFDTPLGTISGSPRADMRHNLIKMNRDRMDRERLIDLMSAVRHDSVASSGLDLSVLWVDKLKRNYDLVCIVIPNDGRAANYDGYFYVNPSPPSPEFVGTDRRAVDPPTFTATPTSMETRLFAHEFSHSFSLGDEYGGSEISRMTQPTVDRAQRAYPNLQSPNSLDRSGSIHGDEIKWRWPRIRWAAELIGPITGAGDVFEAPIRASHAFAFPIDQLVHLRFRDINAAFRDVREIDETSHLPKLPKVSVPLRLVETFETGSPRVMNVRLRVDSSAAFTYPAASLVQPANFAAEFPSGSIVYAPTPAPSVAYDAASYPYAEVIAKNIREFITHRVSTGRPAALGGASSGFPEVPDYSGFTFPHCFPTAQHPRVVALYEGGLGNDTGMFHPTGSCMMSDQDSGTQFCHVCKYMLVDAIDPGNHYFLDREYGPVYPER